MLVGTLRANFEPGAEDGSLTDVEVGTNGWSSLIVSLQTAELGTHRLAEWGTTDGGIVGDAAGATFGSSVTIHFRSYVLGGGLIGGSNTVYLALDGGTRRVIRRVELLPGARLVRTALAPARLQLRAFPARVKVRIGQSVAIHYQIADVGFPAHNVGIVATPVPSGLVLLSSPTVFLPWVSHREGTVWFQAASPGRYQVHLLVHGATGVGAFGGARTIVEVDVERRWPLVTPITDLPHMRGL